MSAAIKKNRAVFLDRDGVLNRAIVKDRRPYSPLSIKEFEILPGVEEALSKLKAAGFKLVVVTNQPDVATGKTTEAAVRELHLKLQAKTAIDSIKTCFHSDNDNCECRKPQPGMLLEAAAELNIDLGSSYMVGDRWRDIEAGRAAGCKTIWIQTDYDEKKPTNFDLKAPDLTAAAALILKP